MKKTFLSLLLLVVATTMSSQSLLQGDMNNDGVVDIADVTALVNVAVGRVAAEPITVYEVDNFEDGGEGVSAEPTETEQLIMQMTSDEEEAPLITYNEEDSLKYDTLAQEVLAMFARNGANGVKQRIIKRVSGSEDELAQEAIRNNGYNRFANLIIEQLDWNSGRWGLTRYGGFETFYNTYMENGKRYLMVVFYYKGGFPNTKTAYLKLGQVNSGKILGKTKITVGREYAFLSVCIDDYLTNYGCVNFFPLLITEVSQARNYLNPFMVKSEPIVADDWRSQYFGYEFGKINGVSVYFNNNNTNQGDGYFQCVELCKRYVAELNSNITRRAEEGGWGNAWNWPNDRANDSEDPNKYIVFANDGSRKVREGDLIVWKKWYYKKNNDDRLWPTGHIGVVIKTTDKYISIAHQNGGIGSDARPIGSTLKIENGIVKDIMPGGNKSPIYSISHEIGSFIRINHFAEDTASYTASMTADATSIAFGEVKVGMSSTQTFRVTNPIGMSPLAISSMSLSKGEAFTVSGNTNPIAPGETREFTVTFNPTKAGEYKDRLIITSNADDNPQWVIFLSGNGYGSATFDGQIVMTRKLLVHHNGRYNYSRIVFWFDNDKTLTLGYFNNACERCYGIHIISSTALNGDGFVTPWMGSLTKDWSIAPVILDEWFTEKIIIGADGHVKYYLNNEYMGEEVFDNLNLEETSSCKVMISPWGWHTGMYTYMDNFYLSTPAKTFSDNFNDGVIDLSIWKELVNPDGVREEDGIVKMKQLRSDQDFNLFIENVPLR